MAGSTKGCLAMDRLPIKWLLVAAVTMSAPRAAEAQWTVYDPANYAENVLHYTNQLTQIRYQLAQLQYQLQALRKLPSSAWRDIRQSLLGIQGTMGSPQSLGYAAPAVGTTFQGYFPVSRPVTDWPAEEQGRSSAAVNVFGAAVQAAAQQQSTVSQGSLTLQRIKALNGAVEGHEQALELQNTVAVYTAEELSLLRQAVLAQTNIQAVYYADRVNTEAQRDATVRDVLGRLSMPQATTYSQSLRVTP